MFVELLSTDLPVRRGERTLAGHGKAVLPHELVVGSLDAPLPTLVRAVHERPVVLEGATSHTVVVHDDDVVVRLAALAVDVRDHQGVRVGVHPLGQEVAEIVDPLERCGIRRIELGGTEGLPVVQRLHRPVMRTGKGASSPRPRP